MICSILQHWHAPHPPPPPDHTRDPPLTSTQTDTPRSSPIPIHEHAHPAHVTLRFTLGTSVYPPPLRPYMRYLGFICIFPSDPSLKGLKRYSEIVQRGRRYGVLRLIPFVFSLSTGQEKSLKASRWTVTPPPPAFRGLNIKGSLKTG